MTVLLLFLVFLAIPGSNQNVLHPRVIGGSSAHHGEFKSYARIMRHLPIIGHIHLGGGTIIHANWVLTAAHLIKAVPDMNNTLIVLGKISPETSSDIVQKLKIAERFVHEEHADGKLLPYDIGLLKTASDIKTTSFVAPALLPPKESVYEGEAQIVGYGKTSDSMIGLPSFSLKKATVFTLSNDICQGFIDHDGHDRTLLPSQMCTNVPGGKGYTQDGDSGGPVMRYINNGKEEVIGIISWGLFLEGRLGLPSIHTRVSYFVKWIREKMK